MDSTPFQKLVEIATARYNSTAGTPITAGTAYRAIILGLVSLITTNVSSAGTVTDKV